MKSFIGLFRNMKEIEVNVTCLGLLETTFGIFLLFMLKVD